MDGTLTLFCGKMGSGKSTLSKQVAENTNAVLVSEDEWLENLFPNKISSLDDYVEYSSTIKPLVKSVVQDFLKNGVDVVMDFPANTDTQRQWLYSITDTYHLYYLDVSDEVCLSRISKRGRPTDTPEMFWLINKHFTIPEKYLTL